MEHATHISNVGDIFHGFTVCVTENVHVHGTTGQQFLRKGEILTVTNSGDPEMWDVCSTENSQYFGKLSKKMLKAVDISEEPWFYRELPQYLVIAALKQKGIGSFLVTTWKKRFFLSYLSSQSFHNLSIHCTDRKRYYLNSGRRFYSVQELLDHVRREADTKIQLEKFPSRHIIENLLLLDVSNLTIHANSKREERFPWVITKGSLKNDKDVEICYTRSGRTKSEEQLLQKYTSLHLCLDSNNIIKMLGFGFKDDRRYVLFCSPGNETLREYLDVRASARLINPNDLISFANQICSGMVYLEKHGIIHNELIVENCFIDRLSMTLRIGGLHYARFVDEDEFMPEKYMNKNMIMIMAPELAEGQPTNSTTDVWAFGLLLWALFCSGSDKTIANISQIHNHRWPSDSLLWHAVDQVMLACLYVVPQIRPSFTDIYDQIQTWPNDIDGDNDFSGIPFHIDDKDTTEHPDVLSENLYHSSNSYPSNSRQCNIVKASGKHCSDIRSTSSLSCNYGECDFQLQKAWRRENCVNFVGGNELGNCHYWDDIEFPIVTKSFSKIINSCEETKKISCISDNLQNDEINSRSYSADVNVPFYTSEHGCICHPVCTDERRFVDSYPRSVSSDSGVSMTQSPPYHTNTGDLEKMTLLANRYRTLYRQEQKEKVALETKFRELEFELTDKMTVMVSKFMSKIQYLENELTNTKQKRFKSKYCKEHTQQCKCIRNHHQRVRIVQRCPGDVDDSESGNSSSISNQGLSRGSSMESNLPPPFVLSDDGESDNLSIENDESYISQTLNAATSPKDNHSCLDTNYTHCFNEDPLDNAFNLEGLRDTRTSASLNRGIIEQTLEQMALENENYRARLTELQNEQELWSHSETCCDFTTSAKSNQADFSANDDTLCSVSTWTSQFSCPNAIHGMINASNVLSTSQSTPDLHTDFQRDVSNASYNTETGVMDQNSYDADNEIVSSSFTSDVTLENDVSSIPSFRFSSSTPKKLLPRRKTYPSNVNSGHFSIAKQLVKENEDNKYLFSNDYVSATVDCFDGQSQVTLL